jgi:hypothetical protein
MISAVFSLNVFVFIVFVLWVMQLSYRLQLSWFLRQQVVYAPPESLAFRQNEAGAGKDKNGIIERSRDAGRSGHADANNESKDGRAQRHGSQLIAEDQTNSKNDFGNGRLLDQREERLAFLNGIRGEFRPLAAADIPGRMNCPGGNEQDVTSLERYGRLALDLVLQGAFQDVDGLFARVGVLAKRGSRVEVNARLHHFAAGNAQVVPLEFGALDARRLCQGRNGKGGQPKGRKGAGENVFFLFHLLGS